MKKYIVRAADSSFVEKETFNSFEAAVAYADKMGTIFGYNKYQGTYYKGTHEPIITEAQFRRTQKILQEIAKPRKQS